MSYKGGGGVNKFDFCDKMTVRERWGYATPQYL